MKKWFGRVWKLCEHWSFGYAATEGGASAICIPGEDTAREAFLSRLPTPPDLNNMSSRQGQLQAISDEAAHSKLRSTACLRDLARLTALSAAHAGAWLRALPAPSVGHVDLGCHPYTYFMCGVSFA